MTTVLRILADQPPHRAAIIIRHAERYPIVNIMDSLGVGLTERGKGDAKVFGRTIPQYNNINVFHSPALRCRETAEQIVLGIQDNGMASCMRGEDRNLYATYVKDDACLLMAERTGNNFLRSWFEGKVDESLIHPPREAADMVLRSIVPRLIDDGSEGLDIHVSHDWDIMLLREQLLGPRPMNEGWLGFLDGLVFSRSGGGFRSCYNGSSSRFGWSNCRSDKIFSA